MEKKIFELLSIKDENVYLKEMINNGSIRKFVIATRPKNHFCKMCGFKMWSKGIKKREIKHPSKLDGNNITFESLQRRYKCKNCNYCNDNNALMTGVESLKIEVLELDSIEGEHGIFHFNHKTSIL